MVALLGLSSAILLATLALSFPAMVALWHDPNWAGSYAWFLIPAGALGLFLLLLTMGKIVTRLWTLWRPRSTWTQILYEHDLRKFVFLISLGILSSFIMFLWNWQKMNLDQQLMFVQRCLVLESGLSPSAPFLLVAIGFAMAWWVDRNRWWYWGYRWPDLPVAKADPILGLIAIKPLTGADSRRDLGDDSVRSVLTAPPPAQLWYITGFGAITAAVFLVGSPQSLEGRYFDWLFAAHLSTLVMFLFAAFFSLTKLWKELRTILSRLELHPIREAFNRMPFQYSGSPLWHSDGGKVAFATRARSRDCLAKLTELVNQPGTSKDKACLPLDFGTEVGGKIDGLRELLKQNIENDTYGQRLLVRQLSELADSCILHLQSHWRKGRSDSLEKALGCQSGNGAALLSESNSSMIVAEEFIALRYLAFIRYQVLQISNWLLFVSSGFVIIVFALNSYPFATLARLTWILTAFFVVIGFGVVRMFLQMERNPLLNRITDTEAHRIQKNFFFQVALYGSLPSIVVLAWIFPRFGSFLYGQLQPLIALLLR